MLFIENHFVEFLTQIFRDSVLFVHNISGIIF